MTSKRYRLKMLSPDQTDILRENYPSVVTPTATSRFYAHQAYIFYHTLRHIARVFCWSIYRTFIAFRCNYKAFCTKISIISSKKPCKTVFSRFDFQFFRIIYSLVINFLEFFTAITYFYAERRRRRHRRCHRRWKSPSFSDSVSYSVSHSVSDSVSLPVSVSK